MDTPYLRKATAWYTPNDDDETPARTAEDAFQLGVGKFCDKLTKDPRKRSIAANTRDIQELRQWVENVHTGYESRRGNGSVRRLLVEFSKRVRYFGNIIDVVSQNHPEYVSLVWGSMKFLFVAIGNHDTLLCTMTEGLVQIADSMPRIELAGIMYPTERMRLAMSGVFANVIQFLIRVHDWCEESKCMRAVHSITRPAELRYGDILSNIKNATENVNGLTRMASQAEQRDMHLVLLEVRQMLTAHQQINASAQLNTTHMLTDLQFSQVLAAVSSVPLDDPERSLQAAAFIRRKGGAPVSATVSRLWTSTRFRMWSNANTSSLIMIKGSFRTREHIKAFAVDTIQGVRVADRPIIWALQTPVLRGTRVSTVDLVKYLTSQALRLNATATERSVAMSCAQVQSARGEQEWLDLLAAALASLKQVMYIVVDVELLSPDLANLTDDFSLPFAFARIFEQLAGRNQQTKVKVILLSYGSTLFDSVSQSSLQHSVVPVGRLAGRASRANRRSGPFRPPN